MGARDWTQILMLAQQAPELPLQSSLFLSLGLSLSPLFHLFPPLHPPTVFFQPPIYSPGWFRLALYLSWPLFLILLLLPPKCWDLGSMPPHWAGLSFTDIYLTYVNLKLSLCCINLALGFERYLCLYPFSLNHVLAAVLGAERPV